MPLCCTSYQAMDVHRRLFSESFASGSTQVTNMCTNYTDTIQARQICAGHAVWMNLQKRGMSNMSIVFPWASAGYCDNACRSASTHRAFSSGSSVQRAANAAASSVIHHHWITDQENTWNSRTVSYQMHPNASPIKLQLLLILKHPETSTSATICWD